MIERYEQLKKQYSKINEAATIEVGGKVVTPKT
jgi:hypothetical protein